MLMPASVAAATYIDLAHDDPAAMPPITESNRSHSIANLGWLEGSWHRIQGTDELEKVWTRPTRDAVMGLIRWLRQRKTWMYELISVGQDEAGPIFRIRLFGCGFETTGKGRVSDLSGEAQRPSGGHLREPQHWGRSPYPVSLSKTG